MKKTLSAIAIATVISSTGVYAAGTAVLNVEGEIQVNGKTVIDATGAFVGTNAGGNTSAQIVRIADYEQVNGSYYYESEDKSYKNTDTVTGNSYTYTGSREKQEEGVIYEGGEGGTPYNITLTDTWSERGDSGSFVEDYTYQYLNTDIYYDEGSQFNVARFYLTTATNHCQGTNVKSVIVPLQEQYQVGTTIIEVVERDLNSTCTSSRTTERVDTNGNVIEGAIPDYLVYPIDSYEQNNNWRSREATAFGALVASYVVGANTYTNCLISEEFTACEGVGDVEYELDNYNDDNDEKSDVEIVKLVSFTPAASIATYSSAHTRSASKSYVKHDHGAMLNKIAKKKFAAQQKIAQNKK